MVTRIDKLHSVYGGETCIASNYFNALPKMSHEHFDRWTNALLVVESNRDAVKRAKNRVQSVRTPSSAYQEAFVDCIITETYIGLAEILRSRGILRRIAFLSSNVKDFAALRELRRKNGSLGDPVPVAKEDLESDFLAVHIEYAHNYQTAKNYIFQENTVQ